MIHDTSVRVMTDAPKRNHPPIQPTILEIRIRGHLDEDWTDWFGGLAVIAEESGDTLLTGPVNDQAALFGLLKKVRDLGMQLVSVNRVDTGGHEIDATGGPR